MCTLCKHLEQNGYYLILEQYWTKWWYVHNSRIIKVLCDKKIDDVAIQKTPLSDACCSLCKVEITTLAPSKFKVIFIDSFKLFGYHFNLPEEYVTLKVVALHCCGILLKIP